MLLLCSQLLRAAVRVVLVCWLSALWGAASSMGCGLFGSTSWTLARAADVLLLPTASAAPAVGNCNCWCSTSGAPAAVPLLAAALLGLERPDSIAEDALLVRARIQAACGRAGRGWVVVQLQPAPLYVQQPNAGAYTSQQSSVCIRKLQDAQNVTSCTSTHRCKADLAVR